MSDNDSDDTELATLRRERDLLATFAVKLAADSAIERQLGAKNLKLFQPATVKGLRAIVGDDGVQIRVLDQNGRVRTMLDPRSYHFRAMTADDLVGELASELENTVADQRSGSERTDDAPAGLSTLDELARKNAQILRDRRAAAANPLTEAERAEARAANPFRRGPTFNLTKFSVIAKRDPEFARELERAAATA